MIDGLQPAREAGVGIRRLPDEASRWLATMRLAGRPVRRLTDRDVRRRVGRCAGLPRVWAQWVAESRVIRIDGPVIIDEHGDTAVYSSVDEAVSDLEVIDVRAGEYEAFDSAGTRLDLLVVQNQVVVRRAAERVSDVADVTARLRRTARAVGSERLGDLDIEKAELQELIAAILAVKPRPFSWRSFLPRRWSRS